MKEFLFSPISWKKDADLLHCAVFRILGAFSNSFWHKSTLMWFLSQFSYVFWHFEFQLQNKSVKSLVICRIEGVFSSCFFHRTSLLCLESFFRCFLTFKFSHKRGYPWPAIAFALMAIFISFWISCNFPNMSFSWAVFLIEHLLCASTFTFGLFLEFEVQPRNCQFCLFTKGHFLNF